MRKASLNYCVDLITLLLVIALAATGLIVEFVLPPGSGGRGDGMRRVLLDWSRHDWGDLHFYVACGLGGLLVLHLALHWTWVCAVTQRLVTGSASAGRTSPPRRSAYGVGVLVVLAGFFGGVVWLGLANVRTQESGRNGNGGPYIASMENAGRSGGQEAASSRRNSAVHDDPPNIRGSTSLADAAASCGATVSEVRTALNLPDSVGPNERLGRLRRQHGVTVADARQALKHLRQQKASEPTQTRRGG